MGSRWVPLYYPFHQPRPQGLLLDDFQNGGSSGEDLGYGELTPLLIGPFIQNNEFKMAQQCYGLATRYAVITNTDKARQNKTRQDKRLIFECYDIPRSLINEPKQAHYACN